MCLQVLCNLRPLPLLLHFQPPSLAVAFVSAPPATSPHAQSHTPQDETPSSPRRSRVGNKSHDLQRGPCCAFLAHHKMLIRLRTAAQGRDAWQTVNLGKVNSGCSGQNAPYRLTFACQETVCRRRQDLFARRLSLSWLSVPR